jgi:outer membrane receptor protein involved in Fe transport
MKFRVSILALALAFAGWTAFAGTTGKIKGKIVDRSTGEALIGATAVITGTSLGASANVDGDYVILNIPAGVYDVEAKFVGYRPMKIGNVRVSADLTTDLDFRLEPLSEGVAMEEIVVQQERPLVLKDRTTTTRIGTSEEIENLPVRGVQQAIVLSPGVVQQNGNIYIRGGRQDEVGYYLEGASTRNVVTGANLTTVIPEALEEFQVQSGGYTAQYGGSNSGIIRQTLRSGTTSWKGSLGVETDRFTSQYEEALGTYSYGYSDYYGTISGPLFTDNIRLFAAGENQFDRDWRVQFWDGFRFENLADLNSPRVPGTDTPTDTVEVLEIRDGNFPGQSRNRYTLNGTVTFDYNPIIVRVAPSYTYQRQQGTTLPVQNIYNLGRQPITETGDFLLNTKATYIASPELLFDVNVFYGDNRFKRYDPDHGDEYLLYSDSLANAAYGYRYRNYTNGPTGYLLAGFPFAKAGTQAADFNKTQQTRWGLNADVTAQIDNIHEIKAGGSMELYTVRQFDTGVGGLSSLLTYYRNNPDNARIANAERDYQVRRNAAINSYGYDVYGNIIDDADNVDGAKHPQFYALYLQDKIEFSDLIINAGLRLDVFDPDDIVFIDDPTTPWTDSNGNGVKDEGEPGYEGSFNPSVDPRTYEYRATGVEKAEVFSAVSPRLGFSFPVTDRTVFHVQYGKFIQFPSLNSLYTGRGAQGVVFTGGNFIPNPVGFDLDPERTTQYEVGFTQQVSDFAVFDITGFYKDVKGQIQIVRETTTPNSTAAGYNTLANGDFATTKGLELSFRLRRVNRFQGTLAYTLTDAKGTGSTTNSAVSSVENGTLYPTVISPLDFEQTHRGTINIDYRFGINDGGPILERFGVNVLFTFNSGHPFTYSTGSPGQQGPEDGALVESDARFSNPLEAVNASTTPWNFNVDLKIDKGFSIGPVEANVFLAILNLFNTQNTINVYRRSGNSEDDGYLNNPELSGPIIQRYGQQYVDLYRAINLGNGQHYRRVVGQDLWSAPRQIRFGFRFEI